MGGEGRPTSNSHQMSDLKSGKSAGEPLGSGTEPAERPRNFVESRSVSMEEYIFTGTGSTNEGGAVNWLPGAPERQHLTLIPPRFQSDGELLMATR